MRAESPDAKMGHVHRSEVAHRVSAVRSVGVARVASAGAVLAAALEAPALVPIVLVEAATAVLVLVPFAFATGTSPPGIALFGALAPALVLAALPPPLLQTAEAFAPALLVLAASTAFASVAFVFGVEAAFLVSRAHLCAAPSALVLAPAMAAVSVALVFRREARFVVARALVTAGSPRPLRPLRLSSCSLRGISVPPDSRRSHLRRARGGRAKSEADGRDVRRDPARDSTPLDVESA
jgi:hypothetical protein